MSHIQSRRQFVASLAAVTAGGMALSACGASSSADNNGSSASSGKSGSLSVGMRSILTSLTPLGTQGYQWGQMMGYALYDPLIKLEASGAMSPVLAVSWDISSPTTTIIDVRPGAYFQTGDPVTAADVAYSIAVRSDPKLITQTSGRPIMTPSQWVSAEVIGTHRVRINTTGRVPILTQPQPVLVVPNNAFTRYNLNTTAVGSGPFKVSQFVSGTSLTLTPNSKYWAGVPKLSRLSFEFFSDVAAEALNIRSGEVDALYDVDPLNIKQVNGIPGKKTIREATYASWWMIQMGKPPLDNPAVRAALRYCFNMPLINQSAFAGIGEHPWNPFEFYPAEYRVDLKVNATYDPQKAKSLLSAAGVKNLSIPITGIDTYQDSINAGQIIEQGFRAAGIQTTFSTLPITTWYEETFTKGSWEGLAFNAGNIPIPFVNLWNYMINPSGLLSAYTAGAPNPQAAALYNEINNAAPDQEPALLKQAQEMLINDAVSYFMFGGPVNLVLPTNLQNVEINEYGDVRWNQAAFS